jgi:hypothetical protein
LRSPSCRGGVGQVLFAAAPPIDWAWDWLRHKKRIKGRKLVDPADKAVVALRFALLGLAVTDHSRSPWSERAAPKALPVILALLLAEPVAHIGLGFCKGCIISTLMIIAVLLLSCWLFFRRNSWKKTAVTVLILLLVGTVAVYNGFGFGSGWGCGPETTLVTDSPDYCSRGTPLPIALRLIPILVAIAVLLLSCWLSFLKDIRKAGVAVAEKEATRQHGDWARQYLRQVNIATAPVTLSAIRETAKDTEEAARKLLQIAGLLRTPGSIAAQRIPPHEITNFEQSATALQEQAVRLQETADSVGLAQEEAAEAANVLEQANDEVHSAKRAYMLSRFRHRGGAQTEAAKTRLENAQTGLTNAITEEQPKKTRLNSATANLGLVKLATERAQRVADAAAQLILTKTNDLMLQAAVRVRLKLQPGVGAPCRAVA